MATQGIKRSAPEEQNLVEDIKAVVVDVEGTTTPISFVKETLFPHIRENVKSYLESHWDSDECKADVQALRDQAASDKECDGFVKIEEGDDKDAVIQSLVNNVLWQMDGDRKATALKQLQGHMWREAYKSGKIQGQVYDDVAPALRELISEKRKVYCYSSGSVEAQKLLFGYSSCGSLSDLFSGNFDTSTGAKVEKDSYTKIATELGFSPNEVLFLTDMPNEAAPASEAGMKTCLVVRDGNAPLSDDDLQKFNVIESFNELTSSQSEVPTKRVETTKEKQNGDDAAPAAASDDLEPGEVVPGKKAVDDDEAEVIDDDDEEDDEDDDDVEEIVDDEEDEAEAGAGEGKAAEEEAADSTNSAD